MFTLSIVSKLFYAWYFQYLKYLRICFFFMLFLLNFANEVFFLWVLCEFFLIVLESHLCRNFWGLIWSWVPLERIFPCFSVSPTPGHFNLTFSACIFLYHPSSMNLDCWLMVTNSQWEEEDLFLPTSHPKWRQVSFLPCSEYQSFLLIH